MRPSTRNAIFVALGIAILGAEIGAPGGDAKPPRLADGALAAIWPSSLSLLWGKAEATDAGDVPSGTVQFEDETSFDPGPPIETAAMTAARRRSFTRRAQSHLLAELKDWSL
jgi:hypothetical protein